MRRQRQRLDLTTGKVPDYRTFVRHLWAYRDDEGFQISAPPVMYRALFEDADPDWRIIESVAAYVVGCGVGEELRWEMIRSEDLTLLWELRFYSLRALHTFCVVLGDRARVQEDDVSIRVGEFIMWTLGFRWV